MVRALDSRTSQNFSHPVIPTQFYDDNPVLIGQVGLNIFNPGDEIRAKFSGTFGIFINAVSSANVLIRVSVYRGVEATGSPVFSMEEIVDLRTAVLTKAFSFSGSDYNVPEPIDNQLVYSCYVIADVDNTVQRRGPESFEATAYCND